MFRNTYQRGFLSILYSCGSSPLELWDMHVKNGCVRRVTDEEVKSLALELSGTNVATTYIYCPADRKKVLGIRLPFLVMIIKNMKKYFTFEITILDDKNMHRRFRMSNFQSTTRVRPFGTSMPIGLSGSWNQIQFNLADFTRRAYGTNYVETTRMQIHANCRIRRIYFADRLYSEVEMPPELKLFLPPHRKQCVREKDVKKDVPKERSKQKFLESIAPEPPAFEAEEPEQESAAPDEIEEAEEVSLPEKGMESAPEPSENMQDEEEEEQALFDVEAEADEAIEADETIASDHEEEKAPEEAEVEEKDENGEVEKNAPQDNVPEDSAPQDGIPEDSENVLPTEPSTDYNAEKEEDINEVGDKEAEEEYLTEQG